MSSDPHTVSLKLAEEDVPLYGAQLDAIHGLFAKEAGAPDRVATQNLRAWARSHRQQKDIDKVIKLAERARRKFKVLVTIGIGGSDLSARVFHDALNHPYHNLRSTQERGGAPEVYFTGDSFDPFRLHGLLSMLESRGLLRKTLFNVISKSGKTGETIAALMVVRERLRTALGPGAPAEAWRDQVLATTGLNAGSKLYEMHQASPFFGNTLLPVHDGVGGRFSAFSPVGLFFLAATAGPGESPASRVERALAGVSEAERRFLLPATDGSNLAYRLAAWLHKSESRSRLGTIVFYNYADNRCLGDWFVQLYEESVQERDAGLNVIAAKGPTSNHSILNGILRGPRDKVILFLQWLNLGDDLTIPTGTGIGGELEDFEGLKLSEVQTASLLGTTEDLNEKGVPNSTLVLPSRDAYNLCLAMRVLMDTVAVKGRLQMLHIDDSGALDLPQEATYLQEGVEGYKIKTRAQAKRLRKG
ncbi:MAG TPA: hypothetical protein VGN26_01445 [Armatimonadota bacterium]